MSAVEPCPWYLSEYFARLFPRPSPALVRVLSLPYLIRRSPRMLTAALNGVCPQHFIFFVQEFNLVEAKELAPLAELIDSLAKK